MTLQAEQARIHVDHASVVTTRMPTPDECAVGYPEGVPVLVVSNGVRDNVFPHWVTLAFDDPHGQPEPDAVGESAAYVLGVIDEELGLVAGRIADLAEAVRRSPCSIVHLADKIREERAADFSCMDASVRSKASPEKLPSTIQASPAIASATRARKLVVSEGVHPGRQ